jgi:hypothetical protein
MRTAVRRAATRIRYPPRLRDRLPTLTGFPNTYRAESDREVDGRPSKIRVGSVSDSTSMPGLRPSR